MCNQRKLDLHVGGSILGGGVPLFGMVPKSFGVPPFYDTPNSSFETHPFEAVS